MNSEYELKTEKDWKIDLYDFKYTVENDTYYIYLLGIYMDFSLLAFVKSWIQAYIHRQIGQMEPREFYQITSNNENIFFSKSEKNKKSYLKIQTKDIDGVVRSRNYDYQETVALLVCVDKVIGLRRF